MRKMMLMAAFAVLTASAFGQFVTNTTKTTFQPDQSGKLKSTSVTTSSTAVSILWLADGFGSNYTALMANVYTPIPSLPKLSVDVFGAADPNQASKQLYVGGGLNYLIPLGKSGWSLDPTLGLKGLNIADWRNLFSSFKQTKGMWVAGVAVTVPLGSTH